MQHTEGVFHHLCTTLFRIHRCCHFVTLVQKTDIDELRVMHLSPSQQYPSLTFSSMQKSMHISLSVISDCTHFAHMLQYCLGCPKLYIWNYFVHFSSCLDSIHSVTDESVSTISYQTFLYHFMRCGQISSHTLLHTCRKSTWCLFPPGGISG